MSYEILYSKHARRDIERLDPLTKKKIGRAIEQFSKHPFTHARKMISAKVGQYRWRAGDYRIIFDVSGKRIEILRVGHRREIYKR